MAPPGGKQRGSRRMLVPLSRVGIGLVMVELIVELGAAVGEYKQGGDGSDRCQSISSCPKSPSSNSCSHMLVVGRKGDDRFIFLQIVTRARRQSRLFGAGGKGTDYDKKKEELGRTSVVQSVAIKVQGVRRH